MFSLDRISVVFFANDGQGKSAGGDSNIMPKCQKKKSSNDFKITELKWLEHVFYQSILSK